MPADVVDGTIYDVVPVVENVFCGMYVDVFEPAPNVVVVIFVP